MCMRSGRPAAPRQANWKLRSMSDGLIQRLSGEGASVPVWRARTRPASSLRSCTWQIRLKP